MFRTHLLALISTALILQGAGSKAEESSSWEERWNHIQRHSLPTNDQAALFDDLGNVINCMEIFKAAGSPPGAEVFSIHYGGNEVSYKIVARFSGRPDGASRVMDFAVAYTDLRRLGISHQGAMRLIQKKPIQPPATQVLASALYKAAPWLPFDLLKPVKPQEVPSIFWVEDGRNYLFEDEDVAVVVQFADFQISTVDDVTIARQASGTTGSTIVKARLIFIDPQELAEKTRSSIQETAKKVWPLARASIGNPEATSALDFWRSMKEDLAKKGIDWTTPDRINPETIWH